MKKYLLTLLTLLTFESQINTMHSSGALAGGVIGGFAGGYLLARLIHRDDKKDPAYYSHKEKKMMKKEANKQLRLHRKEKAQHEKELKRLKSRDEQHTQAAQHHREQITHHESIITRIEQELREIFHENTTPDKIKNTREKNQSHK